MAQQKSRPFWLKATAILAVLFGAITLFKAGSILYGAPSAREAVGDYVPFVVQFNFVAGAFYIIAGIGIYLKQGWAGVVSALIAGATILTAAAFALHIFAGGKYEMQTIGALAIRTAFWVTITLIMWRTGRKT